MTSGCYQWCGGVGVSISEGGDVGGDGSAVDHRDEVGFVVGSYFDRLNIPCFTRSGCTGVLHKTGVRGTHQLPVC